MSVPLYKEKDKAIKMRLKGMSYSQIKSKLKVSKGSLSLWLARYPLSPEKIKELRDFSPKRIENFRNTMARKRQAKLDVAFEKVSMEIKNISDRDLFILGFALYWAEGYKTKRHTLGLANTDPSMLKIYLKWLTLIGVPIKKLRFKLHLYRDMSEKKMTSFWAKALKVKVNQFRRPYIKASLLSGLTYKSGFGYGTCNVMLDDTETTDYVLMGIKYIVGKIADSDMRA